MSVKFAHLWWQPFNQYWCLLNFSHHVNSLWPSDAIWRHRFSSLLAEVMACCLTASAQYQNQCWLLISEVLWHSHGNNFTMSAQTTILYKEFENETFEIIVMLQEANKSNETHMRLIIAAIYIGLMIDWFGDLVMYLYYIWALLFSINMFSLQKMSETSRTRSSQTRVMTLTPTRWRYPCWSLHATAPRSGATLTSSSSECDHLEPQAPISILRPS